jgi:hypothetical protein
MIHPFVLQAHGIKHSRRRFSHTRVGIPIAVPAGYRFDKNAAQLSEVHEIKKFIAIPEGPGGSGDGIFESQSCNIY